VAVRADVSGRDELDPALAAVRPLQADLGLQGAVAHEGLPQLRDSLVREQVVHAHPDRLVVRDAEQLTRPLRSDRQEEALFTHRRHQRN